MRALFSFFPLLIIPVAIYNLIALTYSGTTVNYDAVSNASPLLELLSGSLVTFPMISGVNWSITNGEMLVFVAITLLFVEIVKSTSTGTSSILNHAVSMILFIVCLVEFLLMPNFATSTFFIIMSMTLLDVLAGVIVTIVSARRDFGVGEGFA
ncbi:hypothetical protein D1224_08760 [Henriciella barbarensis]|jgi:hypothetical protein|uniref:Uncharacterized protein n=2 Tax=Henriciella TaxID=453849 RepID=A0A399QYW2_9PROT|nr:MULTISPECIES: hypothetical protein [Henriciella]MCZ4296776.1 hypothetical protein [Henriciella marina]RIJ24316.1 hypothetical protein D1224_08760 [Henriciella barbarensis]